VENNEDVSISLGDTKNDAIYMGSSDSSRYYLNPWLSTGTGSSNTTLLSSKAPSLCILSDHGEEEEPQNTGKSHASPHNVTDGDKDQFVMHDKMQNKTNQNLILNGHMSRALKSKNINKCLQIFYRSTKFDKNSIQTKDRSSVLNLDYLFELILMLPPSYFLDIYKVFLCYEEKLTARNKKNYKVTIQGENSRQQGSTSTDVIPIYQHICRAFAHVKRDPKITKNSCQEIATEIFRKLSHSPPTQIPPAQKQHLLQTLMISILQQNQFYQIRPLANVIYQHLMDQGIMVTNDINICSQLLLFSFYGNKVLPFYEIFQHLVKAGYRPKPWIVDNILKSQYPFNNTEATKIVLDNILYLYKTSTSAEENYQSSKHEYRIDFSTLESITYAQSRNPHFMLYLWDVFDVMGYPSPSIDMYENAIRAFLFHGKRDQHAFAVLWEMEDRGKPLEGLIMPTTYSPI